MTDAAKEEYVFEEELVAAQTNLGDGLMLLEPV